MDFLTPAKLIDGLNTGSESAQSEFLTRSRHLVIHLLAKWEYGSKANFDYEVLVERLLIHLKIVLSVESPSAWGNSHWDELTTFMGIRIQNVLALLQNGSTGDVIRTMEPAIGNFSSYQFWTWEKAAKTWSGDVVLQGKVDDCLWILLADICGKSYPANVLRQALPDLWKFCLSQQHKTMHELMWLLNDKLERCLPSDLFVDAILMRLDRDGPIKFLFAGKGSGVVVICITGEVSIIDKGGLYLGLMRSFDDSDSRWNSHEVSLSTGEYLFAASDGLQDQFKSDFDIRELFRPEVGPENHDRLFEYIDSLLTTELSQNPQRDDITIVGIAKIGDN